MSKSNWGVITAWRYSIIFCLTFVYSIILSHSKIEININDGIYEALPIAVAEFEGNNLDSIEFGIKIRDVLVNDLENSGIFRIVENDAFLEIPSITKIRFLQIGVL